MCLHNSKMKQRWQELNHMFKKKRTTLCELFKQWFLEKQKEYIYNRQRRFRKLFSGTKQKILYI